MALIVAGLQHTLPSGLSPWLRLVAEIGGGAATYIATVMLLHHERAMHFFNIAKRIRKPKVVEASVATS